MAIYRVVFQIADDQGRTTNREILFDEVDEADLLTSAADYATDYQALMNTGIVKYTYSREVAVNNAPAVGSNIDAGFTVQWDTSLAVNPTTKVPDPINGIKDGQGGIDINSTEMVDWFANYNPGTARVNINNPQQPDGIVKATLDK